MSVSLPKSVRLTASVASLLAAVVVVPAAAHVAGPGGAAPAHVLAGPIKLS